MPSKGRGARAKVRIVTDLTPEKSWKPAFLSALSQMPVVAWAAKQAGIERQTAYAARNSDEQFAKDWDAALSTGIEAGELEAWRRGRGIGTQKPSDVLLIFMLKAHKPDMYKERIASEHTGKDGGPIAIQAVDDYRDAIKPLAPEGDG